MDKEAELTPLEQVATMISDLSYADMMAMGRSIRDMIQDRVHDEGHDKVLDDLPDIIAGWAESQLFDD